MKLLVFCYEYPPVGGGAANALGHLSRAWVRMGHSVCVVTSAYQELPLRDQAEGVRVIRVRVGRRSLFSARIIEMIRYMARSVRMTRGLYENERPDLCVAFMTLPGGAGPFWMDLKYKVPFVAQLRGGDVPGFGPNYLIGLHRLSAYLVYRIWKKARLLIANSDGLAELAKKDLKGITVEVIPNGVDSGIFSPKEKRETPDKVRLLFSGRFVDAQKNISKILNVLPGIKNARLTLLGDGPDCEALARLAAKLGLGPRVSFTGWLKGESLVRAYQEADIYVSASNSEGMPNAALEAMASGLPLILSDIQGHRELVNSGGNGYLFPAGDETRLKDRLRELIDDPEKRRAMSEQSRRKAVQEYNWETLAARHLEYFEKSLSNR